MNQALVEHAQHDIDGDQRGGDQQRHVGHRGAENLRGALETALHARRHVQFARRPCSMTSVAWPSATPGARLKESVTAGNWPW